MSTVTNRKLRTSGSDKSIPSNDKEKKDTRNERTTTSTIPHRVISRIVFVTCVLCVVYFSISKNKELPLAKRSETLSGRGQSFYCSETYRESTHKYDGCFPLNCGRFVSDKIVTQEEANALLEIAKKGFSLGGSEGGASILDLDSGALSKGKLFVNIYKMKSAKNQFNETDFNVFKIVKQKILHALTNHFEVWPKRVYLTKPTFFSQITNVKAVTDHDEYWHPHVDQTTYKSFHYTCLLYLNDYGDDFDGGRFIFLDENVNRTVEPKKGRVSMFTSGDENLHRVEKLTSGVRYAMTIAFTCNPEYAIEDPSIKKIHK